MELRYYLHSEAQEIEQLFRAVFTRSEGEAEGKQLGMLVQMLIDTTDLHDLYGFVATSGARIIAAIFFSRLSFEEQQEVFLLSPVAVRSDLQGKGVGQKLIRHGLEHLKSQGVEVVVTYGDPAFYSKVGFAPLSEDLMQAPFPLSQPQGWLAQSLTGGPIKAITGRSRCVKTFQNAALW